MSTYPKEYRIFKQFGQITLLLMVCILASGCISSQLDAPQKPALQKVTLQLRWDHQYQFAGYYAAQWMDYYKEAGFDVEIRSAILPDGKILSATQEVENGHADFGIGAADILLARDQGQPLVVLAPIFQQSAAEFYARQDTPMQAPVDLLKLKVARNVNDLIDVELQAMLLSEGIDPQRITPYPLTPGTESITSGKVDVLPGYRISAPYEYQQLGISIKTLRPINYGIDFYGDTLFTRSEWVQRDPAAVERFVQASIKGWEYTLDHPDEIAERITKELPRTVSIPKGTFGDFNHFQIDGVKELTHYPVIQVGNNNPNRWQRMYDLMKKIGIVTHPLDLNSLIFDPEKLAQERESQQKVILVALIVGVISFTGLIFIWTLLLRKTVASKTRYLQAEIQKRKQIEQSLSESEEKHKTMVAQISDVIAIMSGDGIIRYKSPNITRWFGWRPEDLVGTNGWSTVHPDDLERIKKEFFTLLEKDRAEKTVQYRYQCKDGSYKMIELTAVNLIHDSMVNGVLMNYHDITERKESEDKILFQASLLNAVGQAVIATDLDGKVIYFNQSAEKMYGWPASEAVGRNIIEVTVPKMALSQAEEIMVSLRAAHAWSGEFLVQRRDGTVFPAIVTDAPVQDEDGKLIAIIGVSTDITERKKAEDKLERIQLLLNETQRITRVGGWEFDPLINKISWTDEVYRIHGLSKTYDPSRPDLDIQFYAPEDQEEISKAFNLAVEKGQPYDLELQLINAQGAKRWVRTIGQVERHEGKIVRVFGNIMDITERKQNELALKETNAILQAAFDHSQAGIAIADAPDGRLRYVNKAGLAIPNRSEHELVDDIDINQYVPSWQILHFDGTPFQPDEVPLARAVLYGEKCSKEFIIRRANAEDRFVLANAGPILDDAGQVKAGIVVFLDITERRQTEEKLNAAYLELKRLLEEADESRAVLLTVVEDQKIAEEKLSRLNDELDQRVRERTVQLEAANQELEAFAYSVSHDLRAPLRGIDGFSAALLEDYQDRLDEQGHHYLERIRSETQRMGHMIEVILQLSRITRVEMKLEPVNLTLLAQTILDRLQETESERQVRTMIDPDMIAFGDPNLLEIMLTNLLSNAWKFTGKQPQTIIEFGSTLIADQPAFFIRDNGAGFDMAYAKNLFGAFQRMHKQSDFPGTGIGLATVQRIIHRHGGKVWAEAQKDQGATFYFTFDEKR